MTTSEDSRELSRRDDDGRGETELIKRHYDRVAPVYDAMEWLAERLRELRRVLKPGGQLLMLEHVLSEKPVIRIQTWIIHEMSTAAHQPQNPCISLLDDALHRLRGSILGF